jgi:hypothetical protein
MLADLSPEAFEVRDPPLRKNICLEVCGDTIQTSWYVSRYNWHIGG